MNCPLTLAVRSIGIKLKPLWTLAPIRPYRIIALMTTRVQRIPIATFIDIDTHNAPIDGPCRGVSGHACASVTSVLVHARHVAAAIVVLAFVKVWKKIRKFDSCIQRTED